MKRRARTWLFLTAAVLAAVIFFLFLTLPPAPERLTLADDADLIRRTIPGVYHVHTTRSDGTADKASIAAAARRAGLTFAIFTDHGNAMRPPDAPAYIDGVLCIDGVEISTDDGHYVALDIPASPYPLGGAAAAVIEDVARLGGFGIAAHPDSPKASLKWTDAGARVQGLEWLSGDSEWRDERRGALFGSLVHYLVRPAAAMASLLDRPSETLTRWDEMTRLRPVVALAAHDAHGGIGGAIEDGERAWVAHVPSYEAVFKTMSTRVIVERPLTGDAATDARLILRALRDGGVFTTIDAVAAPATLDFHVQGGGARVAMGQSAVFTGAGTVRARGAAPAGSRTVLLRDGREIAGANGGHIEHAIRDPGVYRVEIRAPRAPGTPPVPWLLSNPIYLNSEVTAGAPPAAPTAAGRDISSLAWRVEHDPSSRAVLTSGDGVIRLAYDLRAGERSSQFAAIVGDLPQGTPQFDRVRFTGQASAPMRVSVQLRFGTGEARWGSSVYLSPEIRTVEVPVVRMRRTGERRAEAPPSASGATAILFVVDLTNALPGASGWFSIERPALAGGE